MRLGPLAQTAPFFVCLVLLLVQRPADRQTSAPGAVAAPRDEAAGRLVIVVVDSMPREVRSKPDLMPEVTALARRPDARWIDVHTCSGNFTLPCIQTLLEGRESPFAAGLHNFTGREGNASSLPSIAAAAGYGFFSVSDHTVNALYGKVARVQVDVTDWKPDHLYRDLRAIDEAAALLDDPRPSVMMLHTIGTDKASHHYHVGSAGYRGHFRAVSARLSRVLSRLDLSRDSLVITSDHGHQAEGHHTRDSTALLVGRSFAELLGALPRPPALVEQRDLLYLLAYPMMLPLPDGYEGRYFLADARRAPPRVQRYEALQRRALAGQGYAGALTEQVRQVAARQARREQDSLWTHLPAVLCYLAWLLWWPTLTGWRARLLASAALGAGAVTLFWLGAPERGPWLSLAPAAAGLWAAARGRRREQLTLLLLIGLAALLSFFAKEWSVFFHTRGGFRWSIPIFFVVIAGAGAALAWLRWGTLRRLPYGVAAFCVFCLPAGPYYYLAGANMFQGFVWTGALLGLVGLLARPARVGEAWRALRPARPLIPLALLALATPFLFAQDAGGWEWRSLLVVALQKLEPLGVVAIYYAVGALLVLWLPRVAPRLAFAAIWAGAHAYCVGITHSTIEHYVAAYAPQLLMMTWLPLRAQLVGLERSSDRPAATPDDEGAFRPVELAVFAGALTAMWFDFGGFSVARIDYTFGFDVFDWVKQEHNLFLGIMVMAGFKYGFPFLVTYTLLLIKLGAPAIERLHRGIFYLFQIKIAALLVQLLVGALGGGEKLYELAMGDLLFVFILILHFTLQYLLLWLAQRAGLGRQAGPAPAPSLEPARIRRKIT